MRHRRIRLCVNLMGLETGVATIKVGTLATVRQADTYLACPNCGTKTREKSDKEPQGQLVEHSQLYTCKCGFKASWWGALKRVVRATGQVVEKVRLTADKEVPNAPLYKIPLEKFRQRVSATLEDNAVVPTDETSARNLQKLLVATTQLGFAVALKFNDTFEQRIGVLTLNPDDTVVLKELIPDNLCELSDQILKCDKNAVTPQELQEAQVFVNMLPEAPDSVFTVNDYRVQGLDTKAPSPRVLELTAIVASRRVEGLIA